MTPYRPEIDGLRAIAVLPVILFHAQFAAFAGGFVGVDVFFVISGYLIATIILNDLESGRFSFRHFYERRARRILPALFLVMAACLPFAWWWMLPAQLEAFGQSLIAVALFVSNVLFWQQSGYFDVAAELKPLLHTWSLAVEEQFYLLFPITLALLWRFARRWTLVCLIVVGLISLLVSQWASGAMPSANFYLAPMRIWELMVGAICALLGRDGMRRSSDPAGFAGLGLIAIAVFVYDRQTPFPGLYALLPVLGTCLILRYAGPTTRIAGLLGSPPLVGIGLISYSAYLWHQPIFAFLRIRFTDDPSTGVLLAMIGATLGLAYLSWRFVERPMRDGRKVGGTAIFAFSGIGIALFGALGLAIITTGGFPSRFTAAERQLLAMGDYKVAMQAYDLRRCFIDYDQGVETLRANRCVTRAAGQPRVIVYGDSEAAHLLAGARAAFPEYRVEQWTATSCHALDYAASTARCGAFHRAFLSDVLAATEARDVIVVGSNWINTYAEVGPDAFASGLGTSLARLHAAKAQVVVVGNTPEYRRSPVDVVIAGRWTGRDIALPSLDFGPSDAAVRAAARRAGVGYYAPAAILCRALACDVVRGGRPTMFDGGHLTPAGSRIVMTGLRKDLSQTAGGPPLKQWVARTEAQTL